MAECDYNPVIPQYNQEPPFVQENCIVLQNPNMGFYVPDIAAGKTTEVLAGKQIKVTDQSDILVDRFLVDFVAVVPLTVVLSLDALAAGVSKPNPVLWGTVIDQVDLTWTYNKVIATQSLVNDAGLAEPALDNLARSHSYSGVNIQNNDVDFTINGDDGLGFGNDSQASDTEQIIFGNYRVWGDGERYDYDRNNNGASHTYSALKTFLEDLLNTSGIKELSTTRVKTLYATGGELEHFYYLYPKRWGFATFTKNNFQGGFVRLKRTTSDLIEVADDFYAYDGDEADILIDNGVGEEAFLVYMTKYDQPADATEPIYVT